MLQLTAGECGGSPCRSSRALLNDPTDHAYNG
jgi:hypothetical protein